MLKFHLRRTKLVAGASLCASAVLIPSAVGSQTLPETLYLNTYQSAAHDLPPGTCARDVKCGPRIVAKDVLALGRRYTIYVVGAVSVSGPGPGKHYGCGRAQPKPEFASPGIASQPAGNDAQFRFASPIYGTEHCPALPIKSGAFLIKLTRSSRWFHPVATTHPRQPSDDKNSAHNQHPYAFTVVGRGAAPTFRFKDYFPSDNDGEFRIRIRYAKTATARKGPLTGS